MLNFLLCFWSELATDEVVLHGTIRLDSKIRSKNVHFHESFCREQTLVATKLFVGQRNCARGPTGHMIKNNICSKPVPGFN